MIPDTSSQPAQPATSPSASPDQTPTHHPDLAPGGEVWLPPAVFVRIAPDLEVMQFTGGNVLLALRRPPKRDGYCPQCIERCEGDHDPCEQTDGRCSVSVVEAPQNTMPIVSTAHAELDEDQDAAYRDAGLDEWSGGRTS